MVFRFAAIFVFLVSLVTMPVHAEKRIALVIGNQEYKTSVGPLVNPLHDVPLVGEALKSVGFEVTRVENATRADMLRAINA